MYNGRQWRGPGNRHRAAFGFPWMIFFFIVFFSHTPGGVIIALLIAIGLSLFLTALFSGGSPWRSMGYQQPNQTPQFPPFGQNGGRSQYYQPRQYPITQKAQETPYQPYEQGYSAPQPPYRQEELQQDELHNEAYQEYEQPRSLYPEQLPPMQQQ